MAIHKLNLTALIGAFQSRAKRVSSASFSRDLTKTTWIFGKLVLPCIADFKYRRPKRQSEGGLSAKFLF